ncbi:MAG: hypothetical protein KC933_25715 [Myxococcales bacterium]|nr:hypothetical protein [Myxococcales bacterium]MCB9651553.1 hypothetical protein [Deltaproteobacteria bacterium]
MWSDPRLSILTVAVVALGAGCGDETGPLDGPPDGGSPVDSDAGLPCPARRGSETGISTAVVSYVQSGGSGALSARFPEPPDVGIGDVLGCFSGCRFDAYYPIDIGTPPFTPGSSTGRITVSGAAGASVSAEYPEYSTEVGPGPFADGEALEVRSPGDPNGAPALQANLRMPVGVELIAPSSADDHVVATMGQGLELRWTRASASTVGVVEVLLSGRTRDEGLSEPGDAYMHRVHCTFPVAADRALIPAAVLDTYGPLGVRLEVGVVERARVELDPWGDAELEARSLRKLLSIDLQ